MTWVACKLNNFTKNEYIAYIIGKSLEGILIYIFKFLTDFRVCFHGAISSTSEKWQTLQQFFGPLYIGHLAWCIPSRSAMNWHYSGAKWSTNCWRMLRHITTWSITGWVLRLSTSAKLQSWLWWLRQLRVIKWANELSLGVDSVSASLKMTDWNKINTQTGFIWLI